jgi:hypothetical protein
MADKFLGGDIVAGSTSVSVPIFLRDKNDLTGVVGLTKDDVVIEYWRQGGSAVVDVTPEALGSLGADYLSGGFYEVGRGSYRVDLPNAMLVSGADWVMLYVSVNASGFDVFTYPFLFTLSTNVKQSGDSSPKVDRLLGLSFENSYQHSQVYSGDKLVSYVMDVYDSKANAILHDGATGLVATYAGLFTYFGDNLASFRVTREA